MWRFTIILALTATTIAAAGSAWAQCGPAVQLGTPAGNPEKDTVGFLCESDAASQTGSLSRLPRHESVQVGIRTGDPERDSVGYALSTSAQ